MLIYIILWSVNLYYIVKRRLTVDVAAGRGRDENIADEGHVIDPACNGTAGPDFVSVWGEIQRHNWPFEVVTRDEERQPGEKK